MNKKYLLFLAFVPLLASCATSFPIGPEAKFGTVTLAYELPTQLPAWQNQPTYK